MMGHFLCKYVLLFLYGHNRHSIFDFSSPSSSMCSSVATFPHLSPRNSPLQHTANPAPHWNPLHHTETTPTHSNTPSLSQRNTLLQNTAPHCNPLQPTATHPPYLNATLSVLSPRYKHVP